MKRLKLNKKKITIFILIIICVFSSVGLGIYSLAKYIINDSEKTLVIPANFKFSSNYLKDNNPIYNIYNWEDGLAIELYNSVNTNKSEIDIPYTITVTNGTSNVQSGTITTDENLDTFTITPTDISSPVAISVSSDTYNYALSATFNFINTGRKPYYTFTNNNEYCELIIYTSSENLSSLTINWNSNYIPDNTNPLMENWTGISGNLSLNKNTRYAFIFFKNTNTVYSNISNTEIQNNIIILP